jgi:hypothetical protein
MSETHASVCVAEPFTELRASLERLHVWLRAQERQFADIEERSPPVSAAATAARRLRALFRTRPHVSG